jgi:hypothetical protein
MLKRRLSEDPKASRDGKGPLSTGRNGCPDIWELEDGSFLVIGTDRTDELRSLAGKGIHFDETKERIVVIPRSTLVSAKDSIPSV